MKTLTAADQTSLVRLASSLPKGSDERRAILAGLKAARGIGMDPIREWKGGDDATKAKVIGGQIERASDILRMVKIMGQKTPGVDTGKVTSIVRSLDDLYLAVM